MKSTSRPTGRLMSMRHRVHSARLLRATAKALTPPPPWSYAAFGDESIVVPPARIENPGQIRIGAGVLIHEHAWLLVRTTSESVPAALTIGDRTILGRFAKLVSFGSISIGADVILAERVYISDVEYEPTSLDVHPDQHPLTTPRPVVLETGAFVGVGVIVKPGVTIGERAYIGAGAIVTEDVPAHSVAVGQPARVIRRYDPDTDSW
jgi:acetyltransferase-like isoleucine patch superfamily enzyme